MDIHDGIILQPCSHDTSSNPRGSPASGCLRCLVQLRGEAARLYGIAPGGEILISQETYDLVKERVNVKPIVGVKLKGVPDGIVIYQALDILAEARG